MLSIAVCIALNGFVQALVLYSVPNFVTDSNLLWIAKYAAKNPPLSKERGIFDQLCGFQSRWEWRFMEWFSLPITSRTTTIHTMAMARLITTF